MQTNRIQALFLSCLMACCSLTASAQEEIIEHEGNKYTIHVERLNPDAEMTLLDVLHICPELMSSDGKTLSADYLLSVDDIFLSVDYEPLLEGIKACDLKEVIVCNYGAVLNATDGTIGTIDLQFKEGEGQTGKFSLNGSTYGNGRIYADVASRGENVTLRAFAQTDLQYGKANTLSESTITSRHGVENAMLFIDWQMTGNDLLKLKLSQGYGEQKNRQRGHTIYIEDELSRQRWGEIVTTYERTLNEQEAGLYFEAGMNYTNNTFDIQGERTALPWWIAECSIPFLNQALWMTAGYEGCYTNLWYEGINREQNLYSDLYVQLDYQKGPWIISAGDRFRHNNYWDKHYDTGDRSLWSYHRNDHAWHASVGYKKGRHFVQGTFSRTFFNPLVSAFQDYLDDGSIQYNTDYKTNLAWRSEARYTYQTEQIVVTGRLTHTLLSDMPSSNESLTGLGASVTWNKGLLRLTGGANVYHQHISLDEAVDDTFFTLKFAPTLLFGKGFRLSSVLLYNSARDISDKHAHFFASVKVNKDLGKRCNVFADFHDLTGQPTGESYHLTQSFKNRAVTLGLTYYPWR
ncbi:MAG: hypothetical protein IJV25_03675 [Prevotella sp.]|nr:hypothetical protein [Prevotella sp.]